jgi:hypothetical protein
MKRDESSLKDSILVKYFLHTHLWEAPNENPIFEWKAPTTVG